MTRKAGMGLPSPPFGRLASKKTARRLARELGEHLLEFGGRSVPAAGGTESGEPIDFHRIGDLGERLDSIRRHRDQHQLVAQPQQVGEALRG